VAFRWASVKYAGQVITALLKNETPPIDIAPFAPERFPI